MQGGGYRHVHREVQSELLILIALLLAGCQPIVAPESTLVTAEPELTMPKKVLFVGNSFTYWNDGIATHVQALAASGDPSLELEAESKTSGGATLEWHWEYYGVPDKMRDGDYDVVVLQGDIRVLRTERYETFQEYARRFHELAEELGVGLVLFMTWDYDRLGWIDQDGITLAHTELTDEFGIQVAPAGVAWQNAETTHPEIELLGVDKEHPTVQGTYLAAAVIYATLFDRSPVGLAYRPIEHQKLGNRFWPEGGVSEEEAAILQQIAWDTVQSYRLP